MNTPDPVTNDAETISARLRNLHLTHGPHPTRAEGMDAMEAVAFLAGEPHSDAPATASPVFGAFIRALDDLLPDDQRDRLVPFLPRLLGTSGVPAQDQGWVFRIADWACRSMLPLALDSLGLSEHATTLRRLPPIASRASAKQVMQEVRAVRRAVEGQHRPLVPAFRAAAGAAPASARPAYDWPFAAVRAVDALRGVIQAGAPPHWDAVFAFLDDLLPPVSM